MKLSARPWLRTIQKQIYGLRFESLLVSFTSPRKLAGMIAKIDRILGFSEHLEHFLTSKDPRFFTIYKSQGPQLDLALLSPLL